MNAINTETTRQFNALAANTMTRGRVTFARKGGLYEDKTNTVRFDYVRPRKQRGAFCSDKVVVAVTYLDGADEYAVVVSHFDGLTLDTTELVNIPGTSWEIFSDLAMWVARAK